MMCQRNNVLRALFATRYLLKLIQHELREISPRQLGAWALTHMSNLELTSFRFIVEASSANVHFRLLLRTAWGFAFGEYRPDSRYEVFSCSFG